MKKWLPRALYAPAAAVYRPVQRAWHQLRDPRTRAIWHARWLRLFYRLPEIELAEVVPRAKPLPRPAPPIPDDICLPPYYGPRDHDDYGPLMACAAAIDPRVVVELGTAYGNTVANLCRQCAAATIYTVNAPAEKQTGALVTFALRSDEIGRVYRAHGYSGRVVQILENTRDLELGAYLKGAAVDLAVIDACHDTGFVINDFLKVQPFMRPGGVVLLHDTHPSLSEHLLGSYRACMLLRKRGFNIQHLRDTWWGIWIADREGTRGEGKQPRMDTNGREDGGKLTANGRE